MLRVLRMTRRSALKARTQTLQQLDSLVVTAPDQLRAKLRRLTLEQLVPVAAGLRPGELAHPLAATKLALAICRMSYDPRTIAHVQRRTREGKSTPEIIRCLKRSIAREVHRDLKAALVM